MTALHDAAMAAKRFHDAALAYLDRPRDMARVTELHLTHADARKALTAANKAIDLAFIEAPPIPPKA